MIRVASGPCTILSQKMNTSTTIVPASQLPLPRSNWVHAFLRSILKYGKLCSVFSYDILRIDKRIIETNEARASYKVVRNNILQIFQSLFQAILIIFMLHREFTYKILDHDSVLNWAIRLSFAPQIMYTFAAYTHLPSKAETWKNIFKQSELILEKIDVLRPDWTIGYELHLGILISTMFSTTGILHIILLKYMPHNSNMNISDDGTLQNLPFLNYGVSELNVSENSKHAIYFVTQIPDLFCWSCMYFGDALRLALAIVMWRFYNQINQIMNDGKRQFSSDFNFIDQVITVHLSISKLMRHCNELVSPLVFTSTIFILAYSCYYINFLLIVPAPTLNRQILFIIFYIRNISFLVIAADVNTKASMISDWLEDNCSDPRRELCLSNVGQRKLTIVTSQAYNKDGIGFSGLNYFTISTSCIATIVSVVITYSLIITQMGQL